MTRVEVHVPFLVGRHDPRRDQQAVARQRRPHQQARFCEHHQENTYVRETENGVNPMLHRVSLPPG